MLHVGLPLPVLIGESFSRTKCLVRLIPNLFTSSTQEDWGSIPFPGTLRPFGVLLKQPIKEAGLQGGVVGDVLVKLEVILNHLLK